MEEGKETLMTDDYAVEVRNCARCGETHSLTFTKLKGDPIAALDGTFTHYAMCPVTEQPIVMMKNCQPRDPELLKRLMDGDLIAYGVSYTYKGYRLDPTFVVVKKA